jgi:glutamate N-acetyltransferase/amino-acid N-acetyltransferase
MFCGIKKAKPDLALLVSDRPATVAGVFTTNVVCAAPVVVSRAVVEQQTRVRAIITNSGNANACTGDDGMTAARRMAAATAATLGCSIDEVLVSSTGVIGQLLPVEKIESALPSLKLSGDPGGFAAAAEAIMTTDTFEKIRSLRVDIGGTTITLTGIAKGSGMIAPNMATMLAYVCTDATIHAATLQPLVRETVDRSFNSILVDNDTSTNDMLLVLANGAAEGPAIKTGTPEHAAFAEALATVCRDLAISIVRDGEGATKLVTINVRGAHSNDDAKRAARSIASSMLVKTAIHGRDANWGRIAAAVGYSGISFDPAAMEIHLGSVPVLKKNYNTAFDEAAAAIVLAERDVTIGVNLNNGTGSATMWTCDLSKEYVHINASYRS